MIASLPMYDFDELRKETDELWDELGSELGAGVKLDRSADHMAAWRRPDLLP